MELTELPDLLAGFKGRGLLLREGSRERTGGKGKVGKGKGMERERCEGMGRDMRRAREEDFRAFPQLQSRHYTTANNDPITLPCYHYQALYVYVVVARGTYPRGRTSRGVNVLIDGRIGLYGVNQTEIVKHNTLR